MNNKILILFINTFFMGGCATMNKSECENADWRTVGMENGADGHLPAYLGKHRTACATYDVTPDLDKYMEGHNIGVKQYCTAANGFNVGNDGDHYNGVCPSGLEAAFLPAYEHGYDHYLLNKKISDTESSIRYKSNDIDELMNEIAELEKQIISDDTSEAQRADLLERVKQKQNQIGSLDAEIYDLTQGKIVFIDQLRLHKSHHQY